MVLQMPNPWEERFHLVRKDVGKSALTVVFIKLDLHLSEIMTCQFSQTRDLKK